MEVAAVAERQSNRLRRPWRVHGGTGSGGEIVRKFGGRDEVPEEVNPFFYAMFQLLPNGHLVLANWQGHGEGFGKSGVQLLEFDVSGEIVWHWSDASRISSLQGVLMLDGLDVDLLHDEREGTLTPW